MVLLDDQNNNPGAESLNIIRIDSEHDYPGWANRETMVNFLHETMKPYHDTREDIHRALDFAFVEGRGLGGFLILCEYDGKLVGAVLMLNTGMKGYIPETLLLMVSVDPSVRGKGIGQKIIERAIAEADGNVKLHVEYDNPAKRLYERIGFTTKYAEMRYLK